MSSRIFAVPERHDWKQAYLAAIREKDPVRTLALIHDTREKLALRHRELMAAGAVPSDEAEALHDAYYLLDALLNSLSHRDDSETMPAASAS